MPIPGTQNAPLFKGKYVTDFTDTLEALAFSSQIRLEDLPRYVPRYCHRRVRYVIEVAPLWSQNNWPATRAYLVKLYGSNDHKPHVSPDKFRKWVKHHSKDTTFSNVQDVDEYLREFTAQTSPLLSTQLITSKETDLLFFKGIPRALQSKIRDQMPGAHGTRIQSPPPVDDILALLRSEFDEDDIFQANDTEVSSDFEDSDLDLSDADHDQGAQFKTSWKSKSKVKYSTSRRFTALPPQHSPFLSRLEMFRKILSLP